MAFNLFEIIKSIYEKKTLDINIDRQANITILKWLYWDENSVKYLKELVSKEYHTILEPNHFYILLFLGIKHSKTPFLGKIKVKEKKENKLYNKIKYIFGWSEGELEISKHILDKVIDIKYWKGEVGIK